jgi:hypothetical protein
MRAAVRWTRSLAVLGWDERAVVWEVEWTAPG